LPNGETPIIETPFDDEKKRRGPRRDDGKPAGRPRAKRVDGQVTTAAPSSVAKRVHTKKPDGLADSAVSVSAEKPGE